VKRRGKDIDQIQDELKSIAAGASSSAAYADPDAPGGGAHYCIPCARHFVSASVLTAHEATKPHKKRVKEVAEPQYTQKEADAGAGATS
jgi:hypothetical protein